jgi:large subunit ribosomal protein L14
MIQDQTIVKVADNTGAIVARVFKVLGGSKRRYASLGDVVIISVQSAQPRKAAKKKDIYKAVVVRQVKPYRRANGSYVSFDDNAVVIIEKQGKEMGPKGNRVFGPVPRDLIEKGWQNIASLAPEIV